MRKAVPMDRFRAWSGLVPCATLALLTCSSAAQAGPYIHVEASSDFSACPGWANMTNAIANVDGFWQQMTAGSNPAGYSLRQRWVDPAVAATDFLDPDRTTGTDTYYFDELGTAFSMYAGHGTNPAGSIWSACSGYADCVGRPIPQGATTPVFCRRYPGSSTGDCTWHSYDRTIFIGNGCQTAPYSTNLAKWGESAFSSTWAGAGTNGGTNVVILSMSSAHNSGRTAEVWPAFAGIHLLLSALNHTGDYSDHAQRGYWFAMGYQEDQYKSVAQSWKDAGAQLEVGPSNKCFNREGTVQYGQGWGINGCGGHIAAAWDYSPYNADEHMNEDWHDVRLDTHDAFGSGYYENIFSCNWDCLGWGFELP